MREERVVNRKLRKELGQLNINSKEIVDEVNEFPENGLKGRKVGMREELDISLSQLNPLDSVNLIVEESASVVKSEDFELSITEYAVSNTIRTPEASQEVQMHPKVKTKEELNKEHDILSTKKSEDFNSEMLEEEKESIVGSQIETPKSSMMDSAAGKYISQRQSRFLDNTVVKRARRNLMVSELSKSIVGSQRFIKSLKSSFQDCDISSKTPTKLTFSPSGRLQLQLPQRPATSKPTETPPLTKHQNHLFEEFFIISAPLSSVDNLKINDFAFLPPTVLFQYPNLPEHREWYICNNDE